MFEIKFLGVIDVIEFAIAVVRVTVDLNLAIFPAVVDTWVSASGHRIVRHGGFSWVAYNENVGKQFI